MFSSLAAPSNLSTMSGASSSLTSQPMCLHPLQKTVCRGPADSETAIRRQKYTTDHRLTLSTGKVTDKVHVLLYDFRAGVCDYPVDLFCPFW
jgi:hypothetical protein